MALFDLVGDENLAAAEREVYRQEILARADDLIAESEGRKPRPNQIVWDMHTEARARLGQRDLAERSMGVWLQKHAPEVAALWAEAPLMASWLDWRQRVGAEHVPTLDAALAAVSPSVGRRDTDSHGTPGGALPRPPLTGKANIPHPLAQTVLPLLPEPTTKENKGDREP